MHSAMNPKLVGAVVFLAGALLFGWLFNRPEQKAGHIKVRGTVTVDGEPIVLGTLLVFDSKQQHDGISAKVVDGKYQFNTDWTGEAKVEIRAPKPGTGELAPDAGILISDQMTVAAKQALARSRRENRHQELVPAKYNKKSELKVTIVEDGENKFDFDLKTTDAKEPAAGGAKQATAR